MTISKKKLIFLGILAFIVLASPPLYYFYSQYQKMYIDYQKTKLQLDKSSTVLGNNTQEVIDKVNKLIELPKETPTIANITDKTKLSSQPFFANAQDGDKVLIFRNSKKAIIYRESTNKIIEVGAISIGESPTSTPQPLTPKP